MAVYIIIAVAAGAMGVIAGFLSGLMVRLKKKTNGTLAVDIYGDQPMMITFDVGLTEILQMKTITLNVVDISDESAYEVEMKD